jgi:ABC-2 type transport system permease protein
MNRRALGALARRDFRRYFNSPTGYVFITLFIFLSAAAAFWPPRFFQNNLANLDQLNEVFPHLLLFFVPAITMTVWADERNQGTDELLLTLPAGDLELVLGKYLATLGVYTVSLLLSVSHVVVLSWLGSPDPGLMASTYVGYWMAGAALIAAGMVGSLLTAHAAVAFILAVLLCGVPVLIDAAGETFSSTLGRRLAPFGMFVHFEDLTRGVISAAALVYFISLLAWFLYVNVVLIGRRHWHGRRAGAPMWSHHLVRAASLAVTLVAANSLVARADARLDLTAERLHSIGDETRRMIDGLDPARPVAIRAFVSPDVPEEYVQQRQNLVSALREIQALAGPRIDATVEETASYTPAARVARERFGIVPRRVADPKSVRTDLQSVFLGVAITSGAEEQVVPFLEHGLSAEYELARAIRAVARASRKRVGIVEGEARILGGLDYEGGRNRLPWTIVGELRKQYELVPITPWERIDEDVDALLVVMPSTLLQQEMENVFEAIRRGVPTLLLVDPIPAMDMRLAPAAPMAARLNPYGSADAARVRRNVGDIQKAMTSVGVSWPPVRAAWDSYRPRGDLAHLPREVIFVGTGSGNPEAFNAKHPATSGLQTLLLMYPGYLAPIEPSEVTFEPLIATGPVSGTASYFQLVQPTPAGPVLNVNLPHEPDGAPLTLAAHIRSAPLGPAGLNLIVVADLDFISDQFFTTRATAGSSAEFDNVGFFLNCLDVLTGDESFIGLRRRRVNHRTLQRVEAATRSFIERRGREEQEAAAEAERALETAREALKNNVAAIEHRTDLDAQARQIMVRNVEQTESRKLDVLRANIEQARDAKIQASRETMEAEVRRIQGAIRAAAVVLPPLPVLALGIVVLLRRRRRERNSAAAGRRLENRP